MGRLVDLDGAGVSLGGIPVLRDVHFTLDEGQVIGVSGPNGSGKTTLIRMLATLVRTDRGAGTILDAEVATDQVYAVRRSIGMIGHIPALLPELTLRENLAHTARLAGVDGARVTPALEVVGLEDAAGRRSLASSFGMKRRVEVAQLLITGPRLLLLDEATSGLDSSAQDLVRALIDRTIGNGGAAVLVSHDRSHLEGICQSVMNLLAGRLEKAP